MVVDDDIFGYFCGFFGNFRQKASIVWVCRQRPTRKPCCGRKTARYRCKIRYVSKFTAASRGSPCN